MAASSPKFDSDEEFQNAIMESAGIKGTSSSLGPAFTKNDSHISLVKTTDSPAPWCDEFEKMISGMEYVELPTRYPARTADKNQF